MNASNPTGLASLSPAASPLPAQTLPEGWLLGAHVLGLGVWPPVCPSKGLPVPLPCLVRESGSFRLCSPHSPAVTASPDHTPV